MRAAHYLHDCTGPDDRLLVLGYYPELFVLAHRGFAAGAPWILPEYFTSVAHQRQMIARIEAHRVPIALTLPEPEYTESYVASFPLFDAFLRLNYREVSDLVDFGNDVQFRVLVRRELTPDGTDARLGLPCFSNPTAG